MRTLSFDSSIEADMNRPSPGKHPSSADLAAIKQADAVILPRGCKKELYLMARNHCPNVFPNYDLYYSHTGKTDQIRLFRKNGLPHPRTLTFDHCEKFWDTYSSTPFPYPCVFKFSWGGEGRYVYLLESDKDLLNCMKDAKSWQKKGLKGFLLQEFIPCGGRSLRAVVMGPHVFTYWRAQKQTNKFYSNLSKGAVIERHSFPRLRHMGKEAAKYFSQKTGLNLIGLDFLFCTDTCEPEPLFLEINYFFRYTGLGGPHAYCRLLEAAIRDWIQHIEQKMD